VERRAGPSPREPRRGARFTQTAAAAVCAALISSMSVAAHAGAPASDLKAARQLFSEAEALRARGEWAEAATKLRQVVAIKETPGVRFHLAYCEEQLGQLVLADTDYRRAEALIREGARAPDVENLLGPAQKALAERLPTVQIRVPSPPPNTRVHLDGNDVAESALGVAMPLDPGTHTVIVEAPERERFLLEFKLAEGEDRVVEAMLRSPHDASAPLATDPYAGVPTIRLAPAPSRFGAREITVIGESTVALAGAVVGIVFLVEHQALVDDVNSKQHTIDDAGAIASDRRCAHPSPAISDACATLPDALDDRTSTGRIATVGFIGAGVFAAAAVTTWFAWPSKSHQDSAVGFVPTVGGGIVRGTF
jgi:hypothetical protein